MLKKNVDDEIGKTKKNIYEVKLKFIMKSEK